MSEVVSAPIGTGTPAESRSFNVEKRSSGRSENQSWSEAGDVESVSSA